MPAPKLITYNGKTQSCRAWSIELGLYPSTVAHRIKAGVPLEQALSPEHIPTTTGPKRFFKHNGKKQSVREWSAELDVSVDTMWHRVRSNSPNAFHKGPVPRHEHARKDSKRYEYHGKQLTAPEIAALEGKKLRTIQHRIQTHGNAMTRLRIRKPKMPPPITPGTSKTFPASK